MTGPKHGVFASRPRACASNERERVLLNERSNAHIHETHTPTRTAHIHHHHATAGTRESDTQALTAAGSALTGSTSVKHISVHVTLKSRRRRLGRLHLLLLLLGSVRRKVGGQRGGRGRHDRVHGGHGDLGHLVLSFVSLWQTSQTGLG